MITRTRRPWDAVPRRRSDLVALAGAGSAFLVFVGLLYGASVFFWSWILMLVLGATGVDYSYGACLLPWGFIMPFFLG